MIFGGIWEAVKSVLHQNWRFYLLETPLSIWRQNRVYVLYMTHRQWSVDSAALLLFSSYSFRTLNLVLRGLQKVPSLLFPRPDLFRRRYIGYDRVRSCLDLERHCWARDGQLSLSTSVSLLFSPCVGNMVRWWSRLSELWTIWRAAQAHIGGWAHGFLCFPVSV